MSLTRRLFTLLAMICLPALAVLWISSRGLLFDTLQRIENMVAEDHLRQTYNQLEFYIERLENWGLGWSHDPQLIDYIASPSRAFELEHFPDSLLQINRNHLLMIFDADQQLLFDRFIGPNEQRLSRVPLELRQALQERLRQSHGQLMREGRITGLIVQGRVPTMLTIQRVFALEHPGALKGYLIFAEYVDQALLTNLSRAMGYGVQLQPQFGTHAASTLSLSDTVLDRTQSSLWVRRTMFGLDPDVRFELSISLDRSLFVFGAEGIERYLVITLASLLALIAALSLFIRQYVAGPVASLTRQVSAIDADAGDFVPLTVGKSREIKILGEKFNHLMASLFAEKERANTTLASIGEAVISVNTEGTVTYLSPVAERLLQISNADACGRAIDALLMGPCSVSLATQIDGLQQGGEVPRCLRRIEVARQVLSVEQSLSPMFDREGRVNGAVLVLRDVSSAELLKQKLKHQSSHDPVTGLHSRGRFEQLIDLLSSELSSGEHAVCYLDLNNFKLVNDNCGHGVGDRLLKEIADAIRRNIRDSDLLARMGGDEFALVLRDVDADSVRQVVRKISEEIEVVTVYWGSSAYSVTVSIGVSFMRPSQTQLHAVLQEADAACRSAKQPGSNNICLFDPDDQQQSDQHQAPRWAVRINDAIDNNRLELFYQDILPLAPGIHQAKRIEVLVRMREVNGELLLPDTFLPAAERYHLCEKLDYWVLEHVYRWLADYPESWAQSRICINLSTDTLASDKFEPYLLNLSRRYPIPNASICFEITERAAIRDQQKMIALLRRLRHQGFRFALDDFGSGFSSYGYLKALPVDFVKIDGGFVRTMHKDPKDYALVQSIHQVCSVLGMQTVAEYVENDAVYHSACQLGIDYVQGYKIGKPKPLRQFVHTSLQQQAV